LLLRRPRGDILAWRRKHTRHRGFVFAPLHP
jgi:hypothetical protein